MSLLVKYSPLILFTVLANAVAQIMLKKGMISIAATSMDGNVVGDFLTRTIFNPFVFFGVCMYVAAMLAHLVVLSKIDVSLAYPFLSLAYVVVAAYAYFFFQENVSGLRMAGIALICFGTVLIAQSHVSAG